MKPLLFAHEQRGIAKRVRARVEKPHRRFRKYVRYMITLSVHITLCGCVNAECDVSIGFSPDRPNEMFVLWAKPLAEDNKSALHFREGVEDVVEVVRATDRGRFSAEVPSLTKSGIRPSAATGMNRLAEAATRFSVSPLSFRKM